MNHPALGWALAAAAIAAGYIGYGWRGVALAFTVTIFWLLLQFSRAVRVLRVAGGNPVGQVQSAVMLHARLRQGMRLPDILKVTQSLGQKADQADAAAAAGDDECYAWTDVGGDAVQVELRAGRVTAWKLLRAAA